jgi:hypothetical protein
MSQPDLSVIIPVFNRGELIRYTLESVRRASAGLAVEVVVVDDGSAPPAAESIAALGFRPEKVIRQSNQGLLFARLAGFAAATGRHVVFLDSDDLVSPEKFRLQVAALDAGPADVSYTDIVRCTLAGDYDRLVFEPDAPLAQTADVAEFFINVQPAPHSPVFRTGWLRHVVAEAFFPPSPLYNPVAEIWFYHNAAPRPGRVVKVPGPHTIGGRHPGARLTDHWEKLGVASLAVMEAFARTCPATPSAAEARQLVAEKVFGSWRRLPRGFSPEFCARELAVWRRLSSRHRLSRLGGPVFQNLARLLGPLNAGRLFRRWQNRPYATCRTLDDAALTRLLAALPPP